MIDEYFQAILSQLTDLPFVQSSDLRLDRRSDTVGFVRGDVYFEDESRLHVRELVDTRAGGRIKYAYHYQRVDGSIIFRYDNAPHFPEIENFPHHKHDGDESIVVSAHPPNLSDLMKEIETLVSLE